MTISHLQSLTLVLAFWVVAYGKLNCTIIYFKVLTVLFKFSVCLFVCFFKAIVDMCAFRCAIISKYSFRHLPYYVMLKHG